MELYDIIQTTGALSGLMCLMIVLLSAKKRLKQYVCK